VSRGKVRIRVSGRVRANSVELVHGAAVAGFGIALFPMLDSPIKDLASGRLRVVLPEVGLPPQTLWLVYPSRRHLAPKVRAFVDFAKERFGTASRKAPGARRDDDQTSGWRAPITRTRTPRTIPPTGDPGRTPVAAASTEAPP